MDRRQGKIIDFEIGDGSQKTFNKLAKRIKEKYSKIKYLCTDKYKVYKKQTLAKFHIRSKSETCLVESFNSSLRDMLARLNRKTKRFSKSIKLLELTLYLFINKESSYCIYV